MNRFLYIIITIAIIFLPCWIVALVFIDHYNLLMNEPWPYVDVIGSVVSQEIITVDEPNGDFADIKISSWYDYDLVGYPDYSKYTSTCASRDYPKKTILKVINIKNGKSVECRVNDWIEHPERDIDLSSFAFKQIGLLRDGLLDVKIIEL